MSTYFHGWRRKFGVVTLVVALIAIGAWIRSAAVCDEIEFHFCGRQLQVTSIYGEIWYSGSIVENGRYQWSRNTAPLLDSHKHFSKTMMKWGETWRIPYWPAFLLLWLLSAWLLLGKPRAKPTAISLR